MVGISIGAAVAGIIMVAMLVLLWRRRNKTRLSTTNNSEEASTEPNVQGASNKRVEIAGESVHEAEDRSEPNDDMNIRAELESDWTGWEASALLEVELSRNTADQTYYGARQESDLRNSIQQTLVDMNARRQ